MFLEVDLDTLLELTTPPNVYSGAQFGHYSKIAIKLITKSVEADYARMSREVVCVLCNSSGDFDELVNLPTVMWKATLSHDEVVEFCSFLRLDNEPNGRVPNY